MKGKVYLVGAGPGDPGLLTVKGRSCLEKADTVVYDYLSDESLLSLAPEKAERIYAGKQASHHTMPQQEINELLVRKAEEGKTVVRLKGGDPFVFGRGGEEALALREHGIQFEIVPGVTSAIAAAAYAGIPVTHRRIAASFEVVTGHEDPGRTGSGLHWESLARGADTLVFLMGVGNLPIITEQLMKYGKEKSTPAALVRWGTKPEQEVLVTTLEHTCEDVEKYGLKPPAVYIVGDVVNLREKLQWYDNKPLFGKRILVTRARAQASVLTEKLRDLGACCTEAPVIRICPPSDDFCSMDAAIRDLSGYDWIIFTSANGVESFFGRLAAKGLDARALGKSKAAAIGTATAERLRSFGIRADIVPKEFRAERIAEALLPFMKDGVRVLIPRAKKARNVLQETLRHAGAQVDTAEAYQTKAEEADGGKILRLLENHDIDMVTFTSSSTVTCLKKLIGGRTELLKDTAVICIGPITAETCRREGIQPAGKAETYTIPGLVDAVRQFYK